MFDNQPNGDNGVTTDRRENISRYAQLLNGILRMKWSHFRKAILPKRF